VGDNAVTRLPGHAEVVDEFVAEYGEAHRALIDCALAYLDENEPLWNLQTPIDRSEYVSCLVHREREGAATLAAIGRDYSINFDSPAARATLEGSQ
jgi:hypothetical protein